MAAKYVKCPHCHEKKLGPYNADITSASRTKGTCSHCGKRYVVDYGKGKIKVSKDK